MLIHLHCLVLRKKKPKKQDNGLEENKTLLIKGWVFIFWIHAWISPVAPCWEEAMKKLWGGAEWDVCFQSWRHSISPFSLEAVGV